MICVSSGATSAAPGWLEERVHSESLSSLLRQAGLSRWEGVSLSPEAAFPPLRPRGSHLLDAQEVMINSGLSYLLPAPSTAHTLLPSQVTRGGLVPSPRPPRPTSSPRSLFVGCLREPLLSPQKKAASRRRAPWAGRRAQVPPGAPSGPRIYLRGAARSAACLPSPPAAAEASLRGLPKKNPTFKSPGLKCVCLGRESSPLPSPPLLSPF